MANYREHKKMDYRTNLVRPAAVFADPSYTFPVPPFQTACRIVDIMSHSYEGYFSNSLGSIGMDSPRFSRRLASSMAGKVMMCPKGLRVEGATFCGRQGAIRTYCGSGTRFCRESPFPEKMLSGYFSPSLMVRGSRLSLWHGLQSIP